MESYDKLKTEMEAIQQKMAEANKNERAIVLKEVGFTAIMFKTQLVNGSVKK